LRRASDKAIQFYPLLLLFRLDTSNIVKNPPRLPGFDTRAEQLKNKLQTIQILEKKKLGEIKVLDFDAAPTAKVMALQGDKWAHEVGYMYGESCCDGVAL
jgi:hypothetical protein